MTLQEFQNDIRAGIPDRLPAAKPYDRTVSHAPRRKEILTADEKVLALKNALRYFPAKHHALLAREFAEELRRYGRSWDHEAACYRASTNTRLSGSGQPRPSSSSLFLFTCWEVYTRSGGLSRGNFCVRVSFRAFYNRNDLQRQLAHLIKELC